MKVTYTRLRKLKLENGRSTPRCLTVQPAIRPSLTKKTLHTCEIITQIACDAAACKEKRSCKRGGEMCACVCVNNQISCLCM